MFFRCVVKVQFKYRRDMNKLIKKKSDLSVQAFDYVQLAFSKFHNHQLSACIKLNGEIKIKVLEQAVNLSISDLPQLVCKFSKTKYYKSRNELKVELISTQNLEREIDGTIAKTLDIENGQQVRIVVIRADKKDTIVVLMSHLLCDGMSMKKYMYLICSYYNKLIAGESINYIYIGKDRGID